jgi:mannose-6-phosphate isomerase-like protein (cupin superfamily)
MSTRPVRLVWFTGTPGAPSGTRPPLASAPPLSVHAGVSEGFDGADRPQVGRRRPARPAVDPPVREFERLLAEPEPEPVAGPGEPLAPEQLERFAAALAADPGRWSHLVRHERDVRVYEQIFSDERVNAWLICWSDNHDTGFHDHDESAGGIAVIAGRVREERLVVGSAPLVRKLSAGACFNVPASAIHRVLHTGAEPAVTIHAYSPPLTRMGAYRVGPDGGLERQALSYEQELRAA